MTKSEKFQLAHQIAKTFEGNYAACFAMALKKVNKMQKFEIQWSAKECGASFDFYHQDFQTVIELIRAMKDYSINCNRLYYAT